MKVFQLLVLFQTILFFSCQSRDKNQSSNLQPLPANEINKLDCSGREDTLILANSKVLSHTTLDSLQGTWISGDDTRDHVTIANHNYIESNSGDTIKSVFFFSDSCVIDRNKINSGKQSGQFIITFEINDSTNATCYRINSITNDILELDTDRRMLNFHKMKGLSNKISKIN